MLCMYVCTFVCMYVCVYVCMCVYVCIYACMYGCMHAWMHVCMYVYTHASKCMHIDSNELITIQTDAAQAHAHACNLDLRTLQRKRIASSTGLINLSASQANQHVTQNEILRTSYKSGTPSMHLSNALKFPKGIGRKRQSLRKADVVEIATIGSIAHIYIYAQIQIHALHD